MFRQTDVRTSSDPNRPVVFALLAVSGLLVLAVVALMVRLGASTATLVPATVNVPTGLPTVTATVTVPVDAGGETLGVAGRVLTGPDFGTVPLPMTLLTGGYVSDVLADRAWVGSGSSMYIVIGVQEDADDASGTDMDSTAKAWASANDATLDPGAWRRSPLGYMRWCATASTTSGQLQASLGPPYGDSGIALAGQGCLYPTSRGASYLWVWSAAGAPDPTTQALLDSYVPAD